LTITDSW